MATFSSVSTRHLLQAIEDYDSRGRDAFLDIYGFAPSPDYTLVHEGRSYDLRAVVGVAHRFATGRLAPAEEFSDGMDGVAALVRRRGFEVSVPAAAVRAAPVRAPRAPRAPRTPVARKPVVREAPSAICPTCSMTLPATGVCDDCG
ncbi:hypothetical protein [Cellulomonas fengjieae]|uniref:hypothetical protein n=1 Tax=Cellulomonas fengjieae TaxID=2819978 RepID=UPI001AB005BF|nr:hypothetical protein [Cellulomonas fengjieae]MBO3102147.1 hypothetical protein [Cellulomonas fengjieae]